MMKLKKNYKKYGLEKKIETTRVKSTDHPETIKRKI